MNTYDPDILNTFRAAVHDVTLKESGNIHEGTKISELGLDSAALMELIGILEETLSIRIKNEETAILNSVAAIEIDSIRGEVCLSRMWTAPARACFRTLLKPSCMILKMDNSMVSGIRPKLSSRSRVTAIPVLSPQSRV